MNTIEILTRLEKVNFTTEQARTITEIIEEHQHQLATKDDLKANMDSLKVIIDATVTKAKYDLVRWIVGAVIANGLIATMLKFYA